MNKYQVMEKAAGSGLSLTWRDAYVLRRRLRGDSFDQIGFDLNLTPERVRGIQYRAIGRLYGNPEILALFTRRRKQGRAEMVDDKWAPAPTLEEDEDK